MTPARPAQPSDSNTFGSSEGPAAACRQTRRSPTRSKSRSGATVQPQMAVSEAMLLVESAMTTPLGLMRTTTLPPTPRGSRRTRRRPRAQTALPADDPVCTTETAANLRKFVQEGTTPPAWVLQLGMPGVREPRLARALPGITTCSTLAGGVVPSCTHFRSYAAVSMRVGSSAGSAVCARGRRRDLLLPRGVGGMVVVRIRLSHATPPHLNGVTCCCTYANIVDSV